MLASNESQWCDSASEAAGHRPRHPFHGRLSSEKGAARGVQRRVRAPPPSSSPSPPGRVVRVSVRARSPRRPARLLRRQTARCPDALARRSVLAAGRVPARDDANPAGGLHRCHGLGTERRRLRGVLRRARRPGVRRTVPGHAQPRGDRGDGAGRVPRRVGAMGSRRPDGAAGRLPLPGGDRTRRANGSAGPRSRRGRGSDPPRPIRSTRPRTARRSSPPSAPRPSWRSHPRPCRTGCPAATAGAPRPSTARSSSSARPRWSCGGGAGGGGDGNRAPGCIRRIGGQPRVGTRVPPGTYSSVR